MPKRVRATVFAVDSRSRYLHPMTARAPLRYGPLRPDQGVSIAEDAALELGDDVLVDDDDRRALDAAITASLQQAAHGQIAPADRVLERLRVRRR
jgi:hypothetical protein